MWWKAATTVYMMGAFTKSWRNANTHILVEIIGQFWDCWYHNTPYYTTNKSDIRACLLITGAHKKMIKTLLRSAMDFVLTRKEKTSSETLNNWKDALELMWITHTMKKKFLIQSHLSKVWITFFWTKKDYLIFSLNCLTYS